MKAIHLRTNEDDVVAITTANRSKPNHLILSLQDHRGGCPVGVALTEDEVGWLVDCLNSCRRVMTD